MVYLEEDYIDELSPLEKLRDILCNTDGKQKLARRFRALYSLKGAVEKYKDDPEKSAKAIKYISDCFDHSTSELLLHEVAYVLGQTKDLKAAKVLREKLCDKNQYCMVRHEAASTWSFGRQGLAGSSLQV